MGVGVAAVALMGCSAGTSDSSTGEGASPSGISSATTEPGGVTSEAGGLTPPSSVDESSSAASVGVTEATAVTLPAPPPPDYGLYEDAILAGARTHPRTIEYANWKAACYAEFGIPARVVGPGHLELPYPPEQEAAANEAHLVCEQRAVDEGVIADPMYHPPERLRLWYRAYVEVAYECLVENGFPVDPPPSMEVWVEEFPDTWDPFAIVGDQADAVEKCPPEIDVLLIELGKRDDAAGR